MYLFKLLNPEIILVVVVVEPYSIFPWVLFQVQFLEDKNFLSNRPGTDFKEIISEYDSSRFQKKTKINQKNNIFHWKTMFMAVSWSQTWWSKRRQRLCCGGFHQTTPTNAPHCWEIFNSKPFSAFLKHNIWLALECCWILLAPTGALLTLIDVLWFWLMLIDWC